MSNVCKCDVCVSMQVFVKRVSRCVTMSLWVVGVFVMSV